MKTSYYNSVTVRKEVQAMNTTVTEKQVNKRIQFLCFLSIVFVLISLLVLFALMFGVSKY